MNMVMEQDEQLIDHVKCFPRLYDTESADPSLKRECLEGCLSDLARSGGLYSIVYQIYYEDKVLNVQFDGVQQHWKALRDRGIVCEGIEKEKEA